MWTVRENREDIDAIRQLARSIQPNLKPYPVERDHGSQFYEFGRKREAVFSGYSDKQRSAFIQSL